MAGPLRDEDNPRISEDHSTPTQTVADKDGWLVCVMVFSLRLFFVLLVAFARAVVIVADDKIPDTLFDQVIPTAVSSSPPSQTRPSSLGSLEARQLRATSAAGPAYYIIFIGREVGYTTSR